MLTELAVWRSTAPICSATCMNSALNTSSRIGSGGRCHCRARHPRPRRGTCAGLASCVPAPVAASRRSTSIPLAVNAPVQPGAIQLVAPASHSSTGPRIAVSRRRSDSSSASALGAMRRRSRSASTTDADCSRRRRVDVAATQRGIPGRHGLDRFRHDARDDERLLPPARSHTAGDAQRSKALGQRWQPVSHVQLERMCRNPPGARARSAAIRCPSVRRPVATGPAAPQSATAVSRAGGVSHGPPRRAHVRPFRAGSRGGSSGRCHTPKARPRADAAVLPRSRGRRPPRMRAARPRRRSTAARDGAGSCAALQREFADRIGHPRNRHAQVGIGERFDRVLEHPSARCAAPAPVRRGACARRSTSIAESPPGPNTLRKTCRRNPAQHDVAIGDGRRARRADNTQARDRRLPTRGRPAAGRPQTSGSSRRRPRSCGCRRAASAVARRRFRRRNAAESRPRKDSRPSRCRPCRTRSGGADRRPNLRQSCRRRRRPARTARRSRHAGPLASTSPPLLCMNATGVARRIPAASDGQEFARVAAAARAKGTRRRPPSRRAR